MRPLSELLQPSPKLENHALHNLNPMPKYGSSRNQSSIQNPPPPLLNQADEDSNWPALPTKSAYKQQQSKSARAPKAGGDRIGSEPGAKSSDSDQAKNDTEKVRSARTRSSSQLNPNAEPYIHPFTTGTNTGLPNQSLGFHDPSSTHTRPDDHQYSFSRYSPIVGPTPPSLTPASHNSKGELTSDQNSHRRFFSPLAISPSPGKIAYLDRQQEEELKLKFTKDHLSGQLSLDPSPRLRDEKPPEDLADLSHTRSRPSTAGLDVNDEANDDPAEDSEFEIPYESAGQDWKEVIRDRRKLYKQFYDNLVLYAGLQNFHDEGSPPPYRFDKSNTDTLCETELRQLCLDCIAYLCDFTKHPGATAAAALQKVNANKTVLWISANQGFPTQEKPQQHPPALHTNPQDIPKFIDSIIREFRGVSGDTEEKRRSVRAKLFRRAIHLATPRMDAYRKNGLNSINQVLKSQKIQASSADGKDWEPKLQELKRLMSNNEQLPELAEWCYQNRKSWSDFIKEKELTQDKDICFHWFERLKHYLYRLSAHAFAVDIIEIAVRKVRSVRDISMVEFVKLGPHKFWYDNEDKLFKISTDGPMNILERLLASLDAANPQTSSDCRVALESEISRRKQMGDGPSQDHPAFSLDGWMKKNRALRRYYHAELQIAKVFMDQGYEYADERFIGCSKRACYVCYHFLKWYGELFKDQKFVLPGTHSKIIPLVKVPWIVSKENETLFMMDKLNGQLARHIEKALLDLNEVPLEERLQSRHLSTHASTSARKHLPSDRRKSTNSPNLFLTWRGQ
jgi:hypothetical protein